MKTKNPTRRSRRPFSLQVSLYLDALTIQLEAASLGPRREALRHERYRVERRFVQMVKVKVNP